MHYKLHGWTVVNTAIDHYAEYFIYYAWYSIDQVIHGINKTVMIK